MMSDFENDMRGISFVCVEDFSLYLLTASFQGHEVLCRPPTLLEGLNIPDKQGVMAHV